MQIYVAVYKEVSNGIPFTLNCAWNCILAIGGRLNHLAPSARDVVSDGVLVMPSPISSPCAHSLYPTPFKVYLSSMAVFVAYISIRIDSSNQFFGSQTMTSAHVFIGCTSHHLQQVRLSSFLPYVFDGSTPLSVASCFALSGKATEHAACLAQALIPC